MPRYWVYTEEGAQGPYDLEAMKPWLTPDHYVAPEGATEWKRASEVPETAALWEVGAPEADTTAHAAVGGRRKAEEKAPPEGEGWRLHHRSGEVEGPISWEALREKIDSRLVAPDTLIQHDHWATPRPLRETRLLDRANGKDDLSELHWELYEIALAAPDEQLLREYKVRHRDYHPKEREILEAEVKARGLV